MNHFSVVQSHRRLAHNGKQHVYDGWLCPSMDLILLVHHQQQQQQQQRQEPLSSSSVDHPSTVVSDWTLIRTLSWQKVISSSPSEDKEKIEFVTWSPDGRHIAIFCHNPILDQYKLYYNNLEQAEPWFFQSIISTPTNIATDSSKLLMTPFSPVMTRSKAAAKRKQQQQQQQQPSQNFCLSTSTNDDNNDSATKNKCTMQWVELTNDDSERDHIIVSPFHHPPNGGSDNSSSGSTKASSSTLLAVLNRNELHLFWNGTFCILNLPIPRPATPMTISLSNNTTSNTASYDSFIISDPYHICMYNSNKTVQTYSHQNSNLRPQQSEHLLLLTLTSPSLLPLPKNLFFNFSWMIPHVQQIFTNINFSKIISKWKQTLQPLDQKWKQLWKLLQNYGVSTDDEDNDTTIPMMLSRHLLHFISCGQTSSKIATAKNNTVNHYNKMMMTGAAAMDQFLTHPLMNPVLLQRTQTTMETQLANLEHSIRKEIYSPIKQWLVYMELLLIQYHPKSQNNDTDDDFFNQNVNDPSWISKQTCYSIIRALEITILVFEKYVLKDLLHARKGIQLIWTWIRSTVSQVKARGTAIDSVQRQVAKQRRISQSTLYQIANIFLTSSSPQQYNSNTSSDKDNYTWTELIIGISFMRWFSLPSSLENQPSSFPNQNEPPKNDNNKDDEIPTLPELIETLQQLWKKLCLQPRQVMSRHFKPSTIKIPTMPLPYSHDNQIHNYSLVSQLHDMIWKKDDINHSSRNHTIAMNLDTCNHQELILVQTCGLTKNAYQSSTNDNQWIHLMSYKSLQSQWTYSPAIRSPKYCTFQKVQFYKQDSLLILMSRAEQEQEQLELWRVPISNVPMAENPYYDEQKHQQDYVLKSFSDHDNNDDVFALHCNVRSLDSDIVRSNLHDDLSLLLSPSRGIGGFISQRPNEIHLFDLEEDEEDEVEEDEDEGGEIEEE